MSETTGKAIPPEKLVRVTFLPEGKTVEFEFGTMPYEHHGKPMFQSNRTTVVIWGVHNALIDAGSE